MTLTANITITLNALDAESLAAVGRALAGITNARVVATDSPSPVKAPPVGVSAPPPPEPIPLHPRVQAAIEKAEAIHAAAPDGKRGPGRPPKAKPAAWAPPVPRPAEGYGKQVAPEGDTEWKAYRDGIRSRLQHVLLALRSAGLDHEKFMRGLMVRYGDGHLLSTVPQGNLAALLEEAEAGPKDHPLTKEALEAAAAEWARQAQATQAQGATP